MIYCCTSILFLCYIIISTISKRQIHSSARFHCVFLFDLKRNISRFHNVARHLLLSLGLLIIYASAWIRYLCALTNSVRFGRPGFNCRNFPSSKKKASFPLLPGSGLPISGRDAPATDFCPEKQPRRKHYWITRAN